MRTGEAFRQVTRVALDKTGTITASKPTVLAIEADGGANVLVTVAAAAETSSEPPAEALDRGLALPAVEARLEGSQVLVGRPRFLEDRGIDLAPLAHRIIALEEAGRTAIGLADELRPDVAEAVAAMRRSTCRGLLHASSQCWRRALLRLRNEQERMCGALISPRAAQGAGHLHLLGVLLAAIGVPSGGHRRRRLGAGASCLPAHYLVYLYQWTLMQGRLEEMDGGPPYPATRCAQARRG